jgi:gliding motility-associated-like protein
MNNRLLIILALFIANPTQYFLSACTLKVTATVIQPSCGSNGTISYALTPAPSNGAKFQLYLNGVLLGTTLGNQSSFNGLQPGTYKIVATDLANGCIDSTTDVLIPNPNTLSATYFSDSTRCDTSKNGKITLILANAQRPFTYRWSPNSSENDSIAEGLGVGTYKVTITDNTNCPFELTGMTVNEIKGKMRATDTIITPTSCANPNGTIEIKVVGRHGPITFKWTRPGQDSFDMPLDSLGAGSYTCTFEDTLKCYPLVISNINIVQNPPPKATIVGTDTVCKIPGIGSLRAVVLAGDSTQLSFSWDNGLTTKTRAITDSGRYQLIVTDASGCADTSYKQVQLFEEKIINLVPDRNDFVKGLTTWISIDQPMGLYNIVWSSNPKDNLVLGANNRVRIEPDTTTYYTINANYGPKCETSATIEVRVIPAKLSTIIIPDVFSPNGDGRNDEYKLRGEDNTIETFEFIVFDRWGNRVYEAYDPKFVWRGEHIKGEVLPNGVYPYVLRYTTVTQKFEKQVISGTILLEK